MISASIYIVACSAKNRLQRRVARLREPRYLLGALAALAYFTFWFTERGRGQRSGRRPGAAVGATAAAFAARAPVIAGIVLLLLAVLAWVLPFASGLLEFSDAEINFLFAAPVSRRQLLFHRLIRSQIGILFGAVVFGVASPSAGVGRLQVSIAIWLIFLTIRTYYTGVTLSRSRAAVGGWTAIVAWTPLAVIAGGAVAVAIPVVAVLANPSSQSAASRIVAAATSGTAAVVLWPFVALARPFFATSWLAFVSAVPGAVVVLAFVVAWMLYSDEALQDVTARAASERERRSRARHATVRARAAGLPLAPAGPTEFALFWKNGMQTLRLAGSAAIRISVAALVMIVVVTSTIVNAMHLRGGAAAACAVSMAVAGFAVILGPQVVRTDLRSDLRHLEVLKTWPVSPGAVVRGEMAWPAAMMTVCGWAAIASAVAFSPAAFPAVPALTRESLAVSAALLMPALVCAQYLVQNTAVLALPGWVAIGTQRPRGVDAMGQRMILFAGALVAVASLMVPGAVVGGIVWLALARVMGPLAMIPAAAACSVVVFVEIVLASELLGPLYERLDVLSVERAE